MIRLQITNITSKNYDNDQINHSFETTENNNENTSFVDLEAKINKDTTIKLYDHDQTEKSFESYNEETKTVQSFVTQEEKIEKGTTLKNYDNDQIDNSFDTTKNNNENCSQAIKGAKREGSHASIPFNWLIWCQTFQRNALGY